MPAGLILCGGGAKLDGILEVAKKELKLPAALGYPLDVSSVSDKIGDPAFSTAISLVKWGSEYHEFSSDTMKKMLNRIKGVAGKGIGLLKGRFKGIWK